MSTMCVGLLVVFFCQEPEVKKPVVVSDFCGQVAPEIKKLRRLSNEEIAALERPRKEAIVSLWEKYNSLCED
jgi:hypothetical protein